MEMQYRHTKDISAILNRAAFMGEERGLDRSAAVASVKRELGGKWAVGVGVWQCAIAWLASILVYQCGGLLGMA